MFDIAWWPEEEFCIEKVKEHFKDIVCFMVDKRLDEDIYRFPVQHTHEVEEKVEEVLKKYGGASFPISIEFAYYSQDDKTEVCSVKNYPERIMYESLPKDLLSLVASSSRELVMCLAFVRIFVNKTYQCEDDIEPFLLKTINANVESSVNTPSKEDIGEIECDCGRCGIIEDFLNKLDKS